MKVQPSRADAFVAAPPSGIAAVLLYGPDQGLAAERLRLLARARGIPPDDPFRATTLAQPAFRDGPGLLRDEAASIPFGGGGKLVIIRDGGDWLAPALEALAGDPPAGSLTLIQAGELAPRSRLRKLAEDSPVFAAIGCYHDDPGAIAGLLARMAAEAGVTVTAEGRSAAVELLGGDRLGCRREIEKLMTFAGPGGRVGREEVAACLGDGALVDLDDLADAAGLGETRALDRALERLLAQGQAPVAIVRALIRHFTRLLEAASHPEGPRKGVAGLKPPPHFSRQDHFARQAQSWEPPRLEAALRLLLELEMACKGGVAGDRLSLRRTLSDLARAASARAMPGSSLA